MEYVSEKSNHHMLNYKKKGSSNFKFNHNGSRQLPQQSTVNSHYVHLCTLGLFLEAKPQDLKTRIKKTKSATFNVPGQPPHDDSFLNRSPIVSRSGLFGVTASQHQYQRIEIQYCRSKQNGRTDSHKTISF